MIQVTDITVLQHHSAYVDNSSQDTGVPNGQSTCVAPKALYLTPYPSEKPA